MNTRLPALSSLRAFEAAARLSSFKGAAEELALTPTAISHRIRALEQALGRPLFIRKVRAVALTAEGERLSAAVSAGFQTIAAAIEALRVPTRSAVTLSTTPAFAAKWLVPRLTDFQRAHPDIDLRIHASNQPVDLHAGQADLAVRYGSGRGPGLQGQLLLADRFGVVASPAQVRALSADLGAWPLIHFDWERPPALDLGWAAWARASGRPPALLTHGIRYSDESHAIQATVAGQGVALLSLVLIEEELHLGLLQIAAEPTLPALAYHLLESGRQPLSGPATVVRDWLLNTAGATPEERSRTSSEGAAAAQTRPARATEVRAPQSTRPRARRFDR